jgi:hypothetical protein
MRCNETSCINDWDGECATFAPAYADESVHSANPDFRSQAHRRLLQQTESVLTLNAPQKTEKVLEIKRLIIP